VRLAYFDCFAGASGDMILGALLDAGVDFQALSAELQKLEFGEWHISHERVAKRGISAVKVVVTSGEHHSHRNLSAILAILEASALPPTIKTRTAAIFRRLAEAEAKVHGTLVEDVHFHEVGAVDTILDVAGAVVGIEMLGVARCLCSPLALGAGFVSTAHGSLPVPPPAVAELVKGFPSQAGPEPGELLTPTGAAILTSLCTPAAHLPPMKIERVGYGAGTRDLPNLPNCLRVFVGESVEGDSQVVVMETNIDDLTPEIAGYVSGRLLAEGALDVFLTPVQMKKNRPGMLLTLIVEPGSEERFAQILFAETTTFGIRHHRASRLVMERESVAVQTGFGEVRVKVGRFRGVETASPEYEDCRRIAERAGLPLREVYRLVLKAYHNH